MSFNRPAAHGIPDTPRCNTESLIAGLHDWPRPGRRSRLGDVPGRPIEGDWPSLWLEATHAKMRESGRIFPIALAIAAGVNAAGRHGVLGMPVRASLL